MMKDGGVVDLSIYGQVSGRKRLAGMNPGERLLKHLTKRYEHSRLVAFRFDRYDAATKTDREGDPVLVFIDKADERGIIKDNQFTAPFAERR